MNIFCIPHAGGTSIPYMNWKKELDPRVKEIPLDLAGHLYRIHESKYTSIEMAAKDLTNKIIDKNQSSNYVLYGHSLGGIIVYGIYQELVSKKLRLPEQIIISGMRDPYTFKQGYKESYSDKEGYEKFVIGLNGFNKKIKTDKKIIDYYLELLKSDLKLLEKYQPVKPPVKFEVPLTILYGSKDSSMDIKRLRGWAKLASNRIYFKKINGDHFFPTKNVHETVEAINHTLFNS